MLKNCSDFSGQGSFYGYTHTCKLHTEVMSWISAAYEYVSIMHGPYLKRTQLLCIMCTVCDQAALVCHGPHVCVNLSCLYCGFLSCMQSGCSLAVALHQQQDGHETIWGHSVFLKYLNALIKNLHQPAYTHVHKAVPLVWGLLRLTPINPLPLVSRELLNFIYT